MVTRLSYIEFKTKLMVTRWWLVGESLVTRVWFVRIIMWIIEIELVMNKNALRGNTTNHDSNKEANIF